MARPLIALLTDFGTRDHYVGAMKAVALGICPDVTLVDITHDVAPHDVFGAALELQACYRYFPAGAVFLVVVDPGVGSSRRALAADVGDYRLVGPDNGVLSAVFHDAPPKRVVELTERRYARPTVSRTFEGRDRFAPAAAWLAKGIRLTGLGRPVADFHRLDVPQPSQDAAAITGTVVRVDRFGNLVTNIGLKLLEPWLQADTLQIRAGDHRVDRFVATYADAGPSEPCALIGSSDHLEIAVNGASASARLGLTLGAAVVVTRDTTHG